MIGSLRALARQVLGVGEIPACMEALEDRTVLAAPVPTVYSAFATADALIVRVRWQSNVPIDVGSIGNSDLRMLSNHGYNDVATLLAPVVVDAPNNVRAYYRFPAAEGRWDFTHNAPYAVVAEEGAVRNTQNQFSVADDLATYNLSFSAPRLELWVQNLVPNGWNVLLGLRARTATFLDGQLAWAKLLGPTGNQIALMNVTFPDRDTPSEVVSNTGIPAILTAPGGAWDFSDTGRYTLQFGFTQPGPNGTVTRIVPPALTRQIDVSFDTPKAEILSTAVRTSDWLITVKYTDPDGIDLGTIGTGDITAQLRGNGHDPDSGLPPVNGILHQAPTLNQDGSVTAVYRINSPDPRGWSYFDNGNARVRIKDAEVLDSTGAGTNEGIMHTFGLWFPRPNATTISTVSVSNTEWIVDLRFDNRGGLIDTSTLGAADISTTSSSSVTTRIQMMSFSNSSTNVLTVRYRIEPSNAVRFFNGTYTISLGNNQVGYGNNQFVLGRTMGSWYLWFPG